MVMENSKTDTELEDIVERIMSFNKQSEENRTDWDNNDLRRTVQKALDYIPRMRAKVGQDVGIEIGEPSISQGSKKSLDVYWFVEGKYEILLNVKCGTQTAGYFGIFDELNGRKIKGELK